MENKIIILNRNEPPEKELITREIGKKRENQEKEYFLDSLNTLNTLNNIPLERIKAVTMVKEGEKEITTKEHWKRLAKTNYVPLDIMFFDFFCCLTRKEQEEWIPKEWEDADAVLFEGTKLSISEKSTQKYSWLFMYNKIKQRYYIHLEPVSFARKRGEKYLTAVYIPEK